MKIKNVAVKRIMTHAVVFVKPENTMDKVADIFRKNNIHHIPVVDDSQKVVGMISKTDYHKTEQSFALFKSGKEEEINEVLFRSIPVENVMTKQVATLDPEDSISVALSIFKENLFHAMPVIDNTGRLLGILTTYDLLEYAYQDWFDIDISEALAKKGGNKP